MDHHKLDRFVEAQAETYDRVCLELEAGRKLSHWIWYIFPIMEGLGTSSMSHKFAITSLLEAVAYIEHPILGPRLLECTSLVVKVRGKPINRILGVIDAGKFRSCMTLFAHVAVDNHLFLKALERYFDGEYDQLTLDIINR